jgi:hypothetical protein
VVVCSCFKFVSNEFVCLFFFDLSFFEVILFPDLSRNSKSK